MIENYKKKAVINILHNKERHPLNFIDFSWARVVSTCRTTTTPGLANNDTMVHTNCGERDFLIKQTVKPIHQKELTLLPSAGMNMQYC